MESKKHIFPIAMNIKAPLFQLQPSFIKANGSSAHIFRLKNGGAVEVDWGSTVKNPGWNSMGSCPKTAGNPNNLG